MFGPKQCSEFEALSTGTAEEVLYALCFGSEGSGAKQCSYLEGKIRVKTIHSHSLRNTVFIVSQE